MIKRIAFTCYPVTDMVRSRTFYEGILGLEPCDNFREVWQEYDIDGTTFAISSMITEFVKPGSQSSVTFEVNNLKATMLRLKAKGVSLVAEEPVESPVCWMAFIKDPDGNTISLHQCK
jgi:predicted enzyme related to lactoylglutathione lyase